MNITTQQTLELNNFISYRAKMTQKDIQLNLSKMTEAVKIAGGIVVGSPITVTYADECNILDIEIILPVDPLCDIVTGYNYVNGMKINNAVMAKYKGNPIGLQIACEKLSEYIKENNLVADTGLYKIPVVNPQNIYDIENIEINMYIGVSNVA